MNLEIDQDELIVIYAGLQLFKSDMETSLEQSKAIIESTPDEALPIQEQRKRDLGDLESLVPIFDKLAEKVEYLLPDEDSSITS